MQALAELGLDAADQQPKHLDTFRGQDFDQVITLCDSAAAECPFWLGRGRQVHLGFPDPAAIRGTEAERHAVSVDEVGPDDRCARRPIRQHSLECQRRAVFRQVRDAIREEVLGYLKLVQAKPAEEPLLRL